MLASVLLGDTEALTGLDGFQGLSVFLLIVSEQFLPIESGGLSLFCRLLAEWG
jgi:hypothetical protein